MFLFWTIVGRAGLMMIWEYDRRYEMSKLYTLGEVSEIMGIHKRTLKYYAASNFADGAIGDSSWREGWDCD